MKKIFYKNLYQSISYFSVIIIFVSILLGGFAISVRDGNESAWILLVIAISLISLYFLIGFPWIFQKLVIDNSGIKLMLFRKEIKNIKWDQIEQILYTGVMRNPAYVIHLKESKKINLDGRKKIKEAILYYGSENIKVQVKNIKYYE